MATAIQTAIDLNIGTLGQFGFSTCYIPGPGQQDETPLKELAKNLHNHGDILAVTIGEMTAVRRLYLEVTLGTKFDYINLLQSILFRNLSLNFKFFIVKSSKLSLA